MAGAAKTLQDPALDAQSAAKMTAFANVLRANGFAVGLAESRDALVVLASPAGRRPALLKSALRALFSATREDWRSFDELFGACGRGSCGAGGRGAAARDSTCGVPSTAASRMAERRSISSGGGASFAHCA